MTAIEIVSWIMERRKQEINKIIHQTAEDRKAGQFKVPKPYRKAIKGKGENIFSDKVARKDDD